MSIHTTRHGLGWCMIKRIVSEGITSLIHQPIRIILSVVPVILAVIVVCVLVVFKLPRAQSGLQHV